MEVGSKQSHLIQINLFDIHDVGFRRIRMESTAFHIASLLDVNYAVPSGSIACAYMMTILIDNQVDRLYPSKSTTQATTWKFNTNTETCSAHSKMLVLSQFVFTFYYECSIMITISSLCDTQSRNPKDVRICDALGMSNF